MYNETDAFDGKRYVADKPSSVAEEYAGPLRATVCIRGRFIGDDQSRLGYLARVTAWAGRTDVAVKYSQVNSNDEHYTYRQISEVRKQIRALGLPYGSRCRWLFDCSHLTSHYVLDFAPPWSAG